MSELREVVYVDGVRTAFGRATADGFFAKTRADDMAVKAVREVLRRNPQLPPERIDDVVFAATAQVGDQGLTLGRDVALLAGLPTTVPGFAVDRMCAGALTATTAGAGEIAMGAADVVLVGGVEHMGHHPMGADVDFNPRFVAERLIDESAAVMGQTAENLHDAFPHLTKEAADAYAVESQRRAGKAWDDGVMDEIVVPMSVFTDEGWTVADRDQFLRPDTTMEALATLRTPFRAGGRVTAGNSAGPDGRRDRRADRLGGRRTGARPRAEDAPRRLRLCRCRARADGPRAGPGDEEGARAGRLDDRRHRPLRAERALRRSGAHVVRRRRRVPRRSAPESLRRSDRMRAPARSDRRAAAWRSSPVDSATARAPATG